MEECLEAVLFLWYFRKAEELMRLTEIRSGCSTLSSLGLTGSCKAIMCLELAAVLCGHHVERVRVIAISCQEVYLRF